jgi:hypothetical protein
VFLHGRLRAGSADENVVVCRGCGRAMERSQKDWIYAVKTFRGKASSRATVSGAFVAVLLGVSGSRMHDSGRSKPEFV